MMFVWNIVLLIVSVLVITSSMVFVYVYQQNRIISLAQPIFLCLIGFGSLVTSLSNIFRIGHCCTGIIWCYFLGQIITSSALFCKLWRVDKVTKFRRKQQIFASHVIWPFITSLFIAISILTMWTIIDPPKYHNYNKNNNNNNEQVAVEWGDDVGHCNFRQKSGIFFVLMVTINIVSELIAIWMSYKTRHIREDLSDSIRIFQVLVAHLVLNACLGSILVAIEIMTMMMMKSARSEDSNDEDDNVITIGSSNVVVTALLWMVLSFLVPIASIGFLIIPKAYYIYYETKYGQLPNGVQISGAGGGVTVKGIPITTPTIATIATEMTCNNHHHHHHSTLQPPRISTEFMRMEDEKDMIKNSTALLTTMTTELPTIQIIDNNNNDTMEEANTNTIT